MSVVFCKEPTKQNIRHRWQTGIQKSINGVEKRSSLYTWFRMETECEYITGVNSESVYIRNHLKKDMEMIRYITDRDREGFLRFIVSESDSRNVCGVPAVYAMLTVLEARDAKLLRYDQAVEEKTGSVVTFMGGAFYR